MPNVEPYPPSAPPAAVSPAPATARTETACPVVEHVGWGERSAWPDLFVLGGSFLVLLFGVGGYGLYEPHEGHFAGVGREMWLSGDWLTPHLNGSPFLNKPPLLYWALALSQGLFGVHEWSARFPVAVSGWLGVVVAWVWGRQLFGRAGGRIAAALLTLSAGWFLFTHQILIDVLLSTLEFAALYYFWRAVSEPARRRCWLGFYALLALALLAKGPVALLFAAFTGLGFMLWRAFDHPRRCLGFCVALYAPLLAIAAVGYLFPDWRPWSFLAVYAALAAGLLAFQPGFGALKAVRWRRAGEFLWRARLGWGVPLAVAPVLAWAWLVESRNPGFFDHVVYNEHLKRLMDERFPRDYTVSKVSVFGYLAVAAIWCAPWTLLLAQAARCAWRGATETSGRWGTDTILDGQDGVCPHLPGSATRREAFVILALGALGPVLLFLPVPSRLVYYCLPAVPPFAMLVAGWWLAEERSRVPRRAAAVTLLLAGAAVFSAGWWAPGLVRDLAVMRAAPETIAIMPEVAWCFGAALLLGGFYFWQERPRAAAFFTCVLCAAAWLLTLQGFVRFQDVRSSKRMVAELGPKLGADAVWVAEGSHELGASAAIGYYLGTDEHGRARTVRVMVDDPRRPQPEFADLERTWALERPELQRFWDGSQPAVFVTDPMRDWGDPKDAPRLPEGAGGPVASYGFRRVYANPAARERLGLTPAAPPR
jgi:4-amino-4-deoxy-L-arabinose transferase-like glycosyltransferase